MKTSNQKTILDKCWHPSGNFFEFKREDIESSIPARFEAQVASYHDRLAIKTKKSQISYADLNNAANCIAKAILSHSERVKPVALLLEHDFLAIAFILGILKAGKIYVPLEPSFPVARNAYMFEDSQASLLVTNGKNMDLAKELTQNKSQLLNIDEIDLKTHCENPNLDISPDSFAYIIYTSGSTGQPKGVMGEHKGILHEIMRITNEKHICPEDRQTMFSPASVSGSIRDIFGSLLNGSALYPYNLEEEGIPSIGNWLIDNKITIYRSVSTLFRQFVSTLTGDEEFPDLRLIRLSGEPAYIRDFELYKSRFPESCIFLNGLGITETGTIRHFFMDKNIQFTESNVPVGYPVEDMEIIILDKSGKDAGINQAGEIAVKSRFISPGYWNREDLTNVAFTNVENTRIYRTGDIGYMNPDGCLVHLGRKDFQIKIRGYRIEVAEIEVAMAEIDNVKDVAVVARKDQYDDQRLIAYFTPKKNTNPTVSKVRSLLAEKLPDYMIPSAFVKLANLPLTPTGKIDRRRLLEPGTSRPELDTPFIAPRTPVEQQVAKIWSQVLGLDEVGINDDFFDLGGHSLLATQIITRVFGAFQISIPIKSLFQSPTVADMATIIAQNQANKADPEDIERILAELESTTEKKKTQ